MNIPESLKNNIIEEAKNFKQKLFEEQGVSEYGLKEGDEGNRKELGQFYTPPELVIQMLEMFNYDSIEDFAKVSILDPTCGSGNLIMGALIVGLSVNKSYPEQVFGNELDPIPLEVCKQRFVRYCKNIGLDQYDESFWNIHLHRGNALEKSCIEKSSFTTDYWFDEKTGKRGLSASKKFTLNRRK